MLTELDMRSPNGVNCWENFGSKINVLRFARINRVFTLYGLPCNFFRSLPRYQLKKRCGRIPFFKMDLPQWPPTQSISVKFF